MKGRMIKSELKPKKPEAKAESYELNMDATMLFRYKLAETQKQLQSRGIISS